MFINLKFGFLVIYKMKKKTLLSSWYLDRVLRKNGAYQVSEDARKEFVKQLEEISDKLVKMGIEIAKSDGRETVRDSDLNFALERLK